MHNGKPSLIIIVIFDGTCTGLCLILSLYLVCFIHAYQLDFPNSLHSFMFCIGITYFCAKKGASAGAENGKK